jgi:hypothetical protein
MYFLDFLVPLLLIILVAQTGLSIMKLEAILKALTEKRD